MIKFKEAKELYEKSVEVKANAMKGIKRVIENKIDREIKKQFVLDNRAIFTAHDVYIDLIKYHPENKEEGIIVESYINKMKENKKELDLTNLSVDIYEVLKNYSDEGYEIEVINEKTNNKNLSIINNTKFIISLGDK